MSAGLVKKPRLILFDLDGTLVDSVPDLARCIDGMMAQLEQPAWGEVRVREWVGNGVERLVKRALVGQLAGEPEAAAYARALPLFMTLYQRYNGQRSQLYPGVKPALERLGQAGYTLACVTNKAEQFTRPLLQALGIHDYFSLITSGDSLPRKKPDPLPLLHSAEHFGLSPTDALMVGDSSNDVQAARAAGFAIVCVPYGYNHGVDIRDSGPDAVIDSLEQLEGLFE
ncbi:phosphoglycolate phosphatase [Sedimenticola hydrogenitrophicus]|uniref:phosphoglycolate phosphatase n=1 Tax=Sedimenticola hydrogenitrophicus TaxID=2967975 RepID=UPI0023B16153|nr:phosphoglycolate phosphatase [Sedimenticola hydrogenitrophicus]